MKKISVIFGTRPEAIKLAPVILALKKHPELICEVCITAQHREMLDQVLEIFEINPDIDLNLMAPNQGLAEFAAKALVHLDGYMKSSKPDLVLVQGDTTTVFTAALAAFYNQIPVGHVEAGLRSGNIYAPFPEEVNRMMATRLTTIHFCPTKGNRNNLIAEGVNENSIHVTGNTVIDALLIARDKVMNNPPFIEGIENSIIENERFVLITGHRRENFGPGFENICNAIHNLAETFPEVHFIYPVHLNPNVQEPVNRLLGDSKNKNIKLIKPVSYLPFVYLMNNSELILTDSGGVQEEGPSLGKPVLVMREITERPEGVEAGLVKLVGTNIDLIMRNVSGILNDPYFFDSKKQTINPYGDGHASEYIVNLSLNLLKKSVQQI
jgi:UDP-N-acetylglucosamine 2-epimerase (non-hydrolysing)